MTVPADNCNDQFSENGSSYGSDVDGKTCGRGLESFTLMPFVYGPVTGG
jgi:hypothetical protein